jgi:hypothetical protein
LFYKNKHADYSQVLPNPLVAWEAAIFLIGTC